MLLTIFLMTSLGVFVAGSAVRAYLYFRMPPNTRLELYPVPKETGRAAYGGSYYEEVSWWRRGHATSFWSEIKEMLKEILFIKRLFDNQRPLWWFSYGFHLGLYLMAAFAVLLALGLPEPVTALFGGAGLVLGLAGSAGLLVRRAFVPAMRLYSTFRDYFQLAGFLAVYATGLALLLGGSYATEMGGVVEAVRHLRPLAPGPLMTAHLLLAGGLLVYIPLGKLSHYVGKFFSFHMVQWDNEPNVPGERSPRPAGAGGRAGARA